MKRSMMVLKIAEVLVEPRHDAIMDQASYLLKKLEQYGMLPPTINTSHNGETFFDINAWETEDEA